MSLLVVALVFIQSLFAVASLEQVGPYFDCSKIAGTGNNAIQAKTNCLATGWCFWNVDKCYYDNVLRSVTDAEYAAAAAPKVASLCTDTNGQYSTPNLYYLTGVHSCDAACTESGVANIYCRESTASYEHNVIDECFYADLAYRVDPTHTDVPYHPNAWCKVNDTYKETGARANAGYYVYSDNTTQDCSLLSDLADICDCLGTLGLDWCHLHPRCTLNKAKNACIKDPCTDLAPGTNPSGVCTPNYDGCTTSQNQQKLNSAGTALETFRLCVATSANTVADLNNDTNECFYAYSGNVTINTQCNYPECNTVTQVDKCSSGNWNTDTGSVDQANACTLEDLQGGYFPTNKYCNDGRKFPAPAAASLVQMPLLLVFVGLLALFI